MPGINFDLTNGPKNTTIKHEEKELVREFSYQELLSIKDEINEHNSGKLDLESLSKEALYFIKTGKDIDSEIEKLKNEKEKLEIISDLKLKKEELDKKITDKENSYSNLNEEFERLNSAPQSLQIGIEMGKISDELELLKNRLKEINEQLDILDID